MIYTIGHLRWAVLGLLISLCGVAALNQFTGWHPDDGDMLFCAFIAFACFLLSLARRRQLARRETPDRPGGALGGRLTNPDGSLGKARVAGKESLP